MSRKFSNLEVVKQLNITLKAMSKFTKIPSEIRSFFTEKRINPAFSKFTAILEDMRISDNDLGGVKRTNCQLTNRQLFQIIILLPFLAVPGFSHYAESSLSRMFGGKKDILYSFMAQDNVDWRNIIWRVVCKLIISVSIREDYKKSHLPAVLISDDSDLPKTGMRMEGIGKIFSHVLQRCILGYKLLAMCWSDGRTQFVVDFSLHGEKGKVDGKEQGLTARQRDKRFARKRDKDSRTEKRKAEYFVSKLERLKIMVKEAIRHHIPFEYLLVDSWFVCTDLVDFVYRSHKKFHLLGMAKMGNTKYKSESGDELTAKAILNSLKKSKSVRYSRRHRCHYATADVTLGCRKVRLFLCRRGKNENWKMLLTTDLSIEFMRAYEIYAMRWSVEVFFADAKRVLDLAGCSARDFSSQIAHVSMVVIRYDILASVKRSDDYETIGGLFADMYEGVHELTVVEKIWAIITEVIAVVAVMLTIDEDELTALIIQDNRRLKAMQLIAQTA